MENSRARGSRPDRVAEGDQVVIAASTSGIDALDLLEGTTVTVIRTGVDSDGDAYYTVLAAGRETLLYEDFVQFALAPPPARTPLRGRSWLRRVLP